MRRWRLDPRNQDIERARRRSTSQARKIRRIQDAIRRETSSGVRRCGICHARRSVMEVTRLRISDAAPSGFVSVRVPYCGQC